MTERCPDKNFVKVSDETDSATTTLFVVLYLSFWKELNQFSALAHSNKKGP